MHGKHMCVQVGVDTCPRTCPSEGAMVCTYRHWFLREPGQGGRPFFQLPANARKITQLMRFRLGCHGLPNDVGRHKADPLPPSHAMNVCASGVRTEGGTRSTWFSNVVHFSIFDTNIPLFLLGSARCDFLLIRPI